MNLRDVDRRCFPADGNRPHSERNRERETLPSCPDNDGAVLSCGVAGEFMSWLVFCTLLSSIAGSDLEQLKNKILCSFLHVLEKYAVDSTDVYLASFDTLHKIRPQITTWSYTVVSLLPQTHSLHMEERSVFCD